MKDKNNFDLLLENVEKDALASSLIEDYIAATPENRIKELCATLKKHMDAPVKADENA